VLDSAVRFMIEVASRHLRPASFTLPRRLPRFLRHLIQSRRTDVVMVSNSEFGYLTLPYLRALAHLLKDPEHRRRLGQAGRTRVGTHFRLDQMGERMGILLAHAGNRHTALDRFGIAREWMAKMRLSVSK
jgi:hypothetical protein